MIKEIIFPKNNLDTKASIALLIFRLAFGGMLMTHGWGKLTEFDAIAPHFMGGSLGLGLAVFAEFFCGMGVVFGFLYRLALIPLIINMAVAFFLAHKGQLVGEGNGELAFLYLAVFVGLMIAGSGRYSIDRYIEEKIR